MSSIAYVTDEKMIEYHRLCGSQNISFWRLSTKSGFKDFHKGDLLFFYAHGLRGKKKGLVGYAHFDSKHIMSLKRMWDKYGTMNGYDRLCDMQEAIEKASRDHKVPEKISCLYLTDVVFFRTPIYPKDVGITINEKLESFTYLDKDDPMKTIRILRKAESYGIDVWAASQSSDKENIFKQDEMKHLLAILHQDIGKTAYSASELRRAKQLIQEKLDTKKWELIRGSKTDCFKLHDQTLEILIPYVCTSKNRQNRLIELIGRMTWYKTRLVIEKAQVEKIKFTVISDEPMTDLEKIVKEINK